MTRDRKRIAAQNISLGPYIIETKSTIGPAVHIRPVLQHFTEKINNIIKTTSFSNYNLEILV